jgi:V8-like Glu-specific endopeptidase
LNIAPSFMLSFTLSPIKLTALAFLSLLSLSTVHEAPLAASSVPGSQSPKSYLDQHLKEFYELKSSDPKRTSALLTPLIVTEDAKCGTVKECGSQQTCDIDEFKQDDIVLKSTTTTGSSYNGTKFRNQRIIIAEDICSGILVSPQIVATAGHCFKGRKASALIFIFKYWIEKKPKAATSNSENCDNMIIVHKENIYTGVNLPHTNNGSGFIGGKFHESNDSTNDWLLIKLDRPVPNINNDLEIAPSTKKNCYIKNAYVAGYPFGLPLKISDSHWMNTHIVFCDDSTNPFIKTNIPAVPSNSGSPIFTSKHELIGLHLESNSDAQASGLKPCTKYDEVGCYSTTAANASHFRDCLKFFNDTSSPCKP